MSYVLEAKFKLKDEFSYSVSDGKKKFEQLGKEVEKTGTKMKSLDKIQGGLSKGMDLLKKTAIGGALSLGGLVLGVKNAYSVYLDYNAQITRNRALLNGSAEDNAKLEKQVRELGKTTEYSATQVAQAHQYMLMAGWDTNQILTATPKLLQLTTASGGELAQMSDMVTDSLTAFGLGVDDLSQYLDVLAGVANKTNADINMLGNSFEFVAADSRSFKEDYREVVVMLGLLADNGIKAGKAGRNLRGIYAQLAKPTDAMLEQFEKTNTKLYDKEGRFKGLRKIIMESKPALEKMTEAERNFWLVTVAGTEGMTIWNSIMNSNADAIKKVEDAAYNSTGSLDKFNGEMKKADKFKLAELKSAWESLQITLAKTLSPAIVHGMEELTKYLGEQEESLRNWDSANLINGFKSAIDKGREFLDLLQRIAMIYVGFQMGSVFGPKGALIGATMGAFGPEIYGMYKTVSEMFEDKAPKTPEQQKQDILARNEQLNVPGSQPTINITMPNATFNNGTDISAFVDSLRPALELSK